MSSDQQQNSNNGNNSKWTSNLVLRADRHLLPKREEADSREVQSIWNLVDPKEMGSKVTHAPPPEELLGKKSKISVSATEKAQKKLNTQMSSVVESLDEFVGLSYRPHTTETKEAYQLLIHFVSLLMGDQTREYLRGATDEIIILLKDLKLKDFDRRKEIEKILGTSLSSDDFSKLVNLGKKLSDFGENDTEMSGAANMDENSGVAVVFEDEDEAGNVYEVAESESEEEEKEEIEPADDMFTEEVEENGDVVKISKGKAQARDALDPSEIDAFWLQRELSKYYPDAHQSQDIAEKILEILGSALNVRDCENQLVQLLDFDKFDLVKLLTQNQAIIFWCTKLARASENERESVKKEIILSGNSSILTLVNKSGLAAISETKMDIDEPLIQKPLTAIEKLSQRAPQKVIDLFSLAFNEGSHVMTNKDCKLPEGSYKTNFEGYEEITIPAPKPKPMDVGEMLIPIENIPRWAREAFKGAKNLNRVQSKVYPIAFESDENMLLCAPTGAGKTNVAMLTILREISKHINYKTGEVDLSSFKIVYVAPMKALVQEMVGNFSSRLTATYGIKVAELTGDQQLTKEQIAETQIIVTTPEKWDIVTRKASDRSYTQLVKLLIMDEIHLLHDERGPVIEAIVSRTISSIEQTQQMVRLVGLSATLPNYVDVAYFLRVDKNIGMFHFDSSYRPCPLQQQYIGITEKKVFKRFQKMNEVCYEKCLEHAGKNQTIIFVHSRKETAKTARFIRDFAIENQTISKFIRPDSSSRQILQNEGANSKNADLQDLIPYGFAMHNAGMSRTERTLVEELFADGHIQVLVSTATLAWGVNLPAHTVIIKGTQVYSPEKGKWTELSPQDVLQMLGRAGRPQYDTFGEGIIITSHSELQFYLSLLNTQLPIESQLITKLADSLNAEIVLGRVRNRDEAAEWLGYTYLYVRMLRSPNLYGVSAEEKAVDPYLEQKRVDLIHSAAIMLEKSSLISYDRRSGKFQGTELGRIASHYYVSHSSMAAYVQHLKPSMGLAELFRVFAISEEFKYITVRDEEKPELQKLLERVPIPVKESVDENTSKINVLLQAYISQLQLEGFALVSDMVYITQSAGRLIRALLEICMRRGWAELTMKVLELCIMIDRRMWTCMSPLRQFRGVNLELMKKLEKKGFPWEKMFDLDAPALGELVNNPRAGKILYALIRQFPKMELSVKVQPVTRSVLRMDLIIKPNFEYDTGNIEGGKSGQHNPAGESFWIFVTDCDGEQILYSEQLILKPKYAKDDHHISFTVPIFEPLQPNYFVSVVSDRWLRSETKLPVSFRQLILPSKFPPLTELLDLQPTPISALKNPDYIKVFSRLNWKYFNPIQTQCFNVLWNSNENTFIGAPCGSGKTACGEIAILKCWSHIGGSAQKMVYVSPFEETCEQRLLQWKRSFGEIVGMNVQKLVGDGSTDLKTCENADLILATPRQWDMISRRWKQRKSVQNIALLVADDAHCVGTSKGSVYEVIISRTRYMSAQLEKEIRIVALSSSLANAKDFGEWMGCSVGSSNTHTSIFNFHPNVRPVPLEIHIQGFAIAHHASLMISMAKPAFNAISQYCTKDDTSGTKQAIVFVPSRAQCLLSASELRTLLNADAHPKKFLHIPGVDLSKYSLDNEKEAELCEKIISEKLDPLISSIGDTNLQKLVKHGIGYMHESMNSNEKLIISRLYEKRYIQILLCSRDSIFELFDPENGEPLDCHFAVIMGTQYYEGKEHRYADYSVSEVLEMCGKALIGDLERSSVQVSENGLDDHGISRALLLCPQQKKEFYKKFLYEGLPIESALDSHLHDHFNAEIVTKTIENKQEAVDYLTWSYLYRRMAQNPNYYNLTGVTHRHMSDHLSELVELTIGDLASSKCIAVAEDEMSLNALNLGLISAYYYINYMTIEIYSLSFTAGTKLRGLLEIISSATEFEEIKIRNHEDQHLSKLLEKCAIPLRHANYLDPHTKANILLQSHFSRFELPHDMKWDLNNSILKCILPLVYAAIDVISSNGWLSPALACMELCQMIVQAMWGDRESPLRQLPYFDKERIENAKAKGIETIFDLLEVEDEKIRDSVLDGLSPDQVAEVAKVANRYPNVEVNFELSSAAGSTEEEKDDMKFLEVEAEDSVYLSVQLQRGDEDEDEQLPLEPISAPLFPVPKDEGWWLVVADTETKQLLSIKRLTLQRLYRCRLDFTAPENPGNYKMKLYFMCDSWIGCDQEYEFSLSVRSTMDETQ